MIKFIVLLAIAGCDAQTTGPTVVEPTDSVNVRDFGAKGDGQTNDAQAFAAALEALPATGGVVRVPAGTYILTPHYMRPRRGLDISNRNNIIVAGDGIGVTTIKLAPDDYSIGGDTHLVFMKSVTGVVFRDLTLDGNLRGSTWSTSDEHRHCVAVWSPSSDLLFERVRFYNCRGDGLFLVGALTGGEDRIDRIRVEDSSFEDNGRSGIAVQRGIRHLQVIGSSFARISDQSIDLEPTGSNSFPDATNLGPSDVLIEDNHFLHTTAALTVTLAGLTADDPARRVVFTNNRVENGSVQIHKADSVLFSNNVIVGHSTRIALSIQSRSTNIRVIGNEIDGNGGTDGAIRLYTLNGFAPSGIVIQDNTIRAAAGMAGIYSVDAENVQVINNEIYGQGARSGIQFGNIVLNGATRTGFTVRGNTVRNFASAVRFSTREDPFGGVSIRSNVFEDDQPTPSQTVGIFFDNTGPYAPFATVDQNVFGRGITTQVLVQ